MPFNPFIVTAALPPDIFQWVDGLRKEHFPPERSHLHAHVTLFHALAPSLFDEVQTVFPAIVREFSPPKARISGLLDFGKGTAVRVESSGMDTVRQSIAERFHGSLTAQDLHEPRLHITIQNKVSADQAKALQRQLDGTFPLTELHFPALELHIYRDGPWEFVKRWAFRGKNRG